eukprot:1268252-Pyramimonas_sp.AAC.1
MEQGERMIQILEAGRLPTGFQTWPNYQGRRHTRMLINRSCSLFPIIEKCGGFPNRRRHDPTDETPRSARM